VKFRFVLLALAAAGAALAQAPKVALVNMEQALVLTTDGQNAEKKLDAQFGPRKAALDQKHKELMALQDKLDKGELSEEDRKKLVDELDEKGDAVDQETTQADADLDLAQKKVLQDLGPKFIAVVVRYAKQHGYDIVFDISSSDMPRLYSENSVDITKEVVDEYEKSTKPAKK
jgi:Skp family chaperone for outer membrane proteins